MTRQKSPSRQASPDSSGLRAKDPDGIRAEIAVLRERTTARIEKDPRKAAVVLDEWLHRPAAAAPAKKRVA